MREIYNPEGRRWGLHAPASWLREDMVHALEELKKLAVERAAGISEDSGDVLTNGAIRRSINSPNLLRSFPAAGDKNFWV